MVYSKFGTRQWAGPLPRTRVVVKDPYALLSMPAVAAATGAVPVLVYRHPGAILASYRRVTWRPRLDEVAAIASSPEVRATGPGPARRPRGRKRAHHRREMGVFWSVLHELALSDVAPPGRSSCRTPSWRGRRGRRPGAGRTPRAAVVAGDGRRADQGVVPRTRGPPQLHNFDRAPAAVAEEWRAKLADGEIEAIERVSAGTLAKVEAARFRVT